MSPQIIAEITLLSLTIPTVVLSFGVVWLWTPAAIKAVHAGLSTGEDWFITGVTLGFFALLLHSLYWVFPWSASLMDLPVAEPLFDNSVYVTIMFQQLCGMGSAYCHIRAGRMGLEGRDRVLNQLVLASYAGAVALATTLLCLKYA